LWVFTHNDLVETGSFGINTGSATCTDIGQRRAVLWASCESGVDDEWRDTLDGSVLTAGELATLRDCRDDTDPACCGHVTSELSCRESDTISPLEYTDLEVSTNGGVSWAPYTVGTTIGTQNIRFRWNAVIPDNNNDGDPASVTVTMSGDLHDGSINDPGDLYVNTVLEGNVGAPAAPNPLTLAAQYSPGDTLAFEWRHGASGGAGQSRIDVLALTIEDRRWDTILTRRRWDPDGDLISSRHFDGNGAPITLDPADEVTFGPCPTSVPTEDEETVYVTEVVDVDAATPQTFVPSTAGGQLVSWNARNRNATTATLQVNGGAVLPLDEGETIGTDLTGHDPNDPLQDTIVVNPGDGAVRVMTVRRVP
jgi:hypothetical protein